MDTLIAKRQKLIKAIEYLPNEALLELANKAAHADFHESDFGV